MPSSADFGFASLCWGLVGLYLLHAVYNLYFHPLRSFPGPVYCKVTGFWYIFKIIRGNSFLEIKHLHDIYGDVVRIAPNELSYNTAEAWNSIYGRNIQLHGETKTSAIGNRLLKDTLLYGAGFEGADTVVNAEGTFYAPQRRALAYAFTRKSLMAKEHILTHYTDRAIENLTTQISATDTVDVGPMFANAIFDFNCKFVADRDIGASNPHGTLHPSVHYFDNILRFAYIPITLRRLPMVAYLQDTLQPLFSKGLLHYHVVGPLIRNRLENGGSETDLISYMERHPKEGDTGKSQILNNAAIFIAAGTGTTVGWLCASVYYILSNPDVKSKIYDEIRNSASKGSDLSLDVVSSMKYLKAVTDESIRIFPPIVATLTRVVPRGGVSICGKYVPQGTVVGVNHWATYRSAKNFKHPDEFHPERWFDVVSEEFAEDHRNALQPFSYGPRKCIAQELASMNSKLFLARLFWEFDMELAPESRDWTNQKGFIAHYKPPLMVKFNKRSGLSETET